MATLKARAKHAFLRHRFTQAIESNNAGRESFLKVVFISRGFLAASRLEPPLFLPVVTVASSSRSADGSDSTSTFLDLLDNQKPSNGLRSVGMAHELARRLVHLLDPPIISLAIRIFTNNLKGMLRQSWTFCKATKGRIHLDFAYDPKLIDSRISIFLGEFHSRISSMTTCDAELLRSAQTMHLERCAVFFLHGADDFMAIARHRIGSLRLECDEDAHILDNAHALFTDGRHAELTRNLEELSIHDLDFCEIKALSSTINAIMNACPALLHLDLTINCLKRSDPKITVKEYADKVSQCYANTRDIQFTRRQAAQRPRIRICPTPRVAPSDLIKELRKVKPFKGAEPSNTNFAASTNSLIDHQDFDLSRGAEDPFSLHFLIRY